MQKNKNKTICFDIDGVICSVTKNNNYKKSKPIRKNIKTINYLYDQGYKIILNTARYMGRYNNNRLLAERKIKKLTLNHLKKWGLKYHKVYFGKPSFDLVIDDKAIFFKKNWRNYIKKNY
tara:strand:+ start:660 stop:1019 length:360 start_codon:yes stop_codon:yes gene_type:complete